MQKLTRENFDKARNFIITNGDEISCAWFNYHFVDNNVDVFMNVLAKYQHDCGGFGGLGYEFEYQGPCLKCTEIAIGYILGLNEKPSANHSVIQKMMVYILDQYIPEIGNWGEPFVPELNDYPHCSWSNYRGSTPPTMEDDEEKIKKYEANEKVCHAAFVALYSEIVPQALYSEIIKYPTQHILRYWDENSPEFNREIRDKAYPYDFEYALWFVQCLKDNAFADKLKAILSQNPTAAWELNFAKSNSDYVHLPCDFGVTSPDSFLYPVVKDLVDDSLTVRMNQQADDGHWPWGWSFGESDEMQRLQLKSNVIRAIDMLVKLKRFDRIES
ncbi:MAG: hypothetical protein FWB93_03240 [Oscillospiraceae bacterium]|nr:hypothetical protein [Oscillospiraceae bacterium]